MLKKTIVLFSFFVLSSLSYADVDEIVVWKVKIEDRSVVAPAVDIYIGILNPQSSHPQLVDFRYESNGQVILGNTLMSFVAFNNRPTRDSRPGWNFELSFERSHFTDPQGIILPRYRSIHFLPKMISLNLYDPEKPTVRFESLLGHSKDLTLITVVGASKVPAIRSEMNLTPIVPTTLVNPPVRTVTQENQIIRWTAIVKNEKGIKGEINVAVFDPQTNPVLIDFSYETRDSSTMIATFLDFPELEKFDLVPNEAGSFELSLLKERIFQQNEPDLPTPYFSKLPYVPTKIRVGIDSLKKPAIFLSLADGKVIKLDAKVSAYTTSSFFPKSYLEPQVREPGTVNSVGFNTFFAPKGIQFDYLKGKRETARIQPAPQNRIDPSKITSVDSLILGESLKNKKEIIWQLLQQKTKPTLAEFLKAIEIMPTQQIKNPFGQYLLNSSLKEQLRNQLPKAIAQFERAFPEAIWYALGRDIYLFGDALDAYYTYKGQSGRVRRLPASAPSFDLNNVDLSIDFLKTHGFDFEKIKKNSKPQIIFDITSYSYGSQSTQLMRAAYTEWKRLNRDPKKLLNKVNFLSVSDGARNVMVTPDLDIKSFFQNMQFTNPEPASILRVEGPTSLMYAAAWHGLYQRFERKDDGRIETPFIDSSSTSVRMSMLAELWEIAAIVMNESFANEVERQKFILDGKIKVIASSGSVKCDDLLLKPIGSED